MSLYSTDLMPTVMREHRIADVPLREKSVYPVVQPDLTDFTREQVEHAVKTVPRVKGVFEKFYHAPRHLGNFKNIAHMELALANFEASDALKLERLAVAEAAMDVYDYLKKEIEHAQQSAK